MGLDRSDSSGLGTRVFTEQSGSSLENCPRRVSQVCVPEPDTQVTIAPVALETEAFDQAEGTELLVLGYGRRRV